MFLMKATSSPASPFALSTPGNERWTTHVCGLQIMHGVGMHITHGVGMQACISAVSDATLSSPTHLGYRHHIGPLARAHKRFRVHPLSQQQLSPQCLTLLLDILELLLRILCAMQYKTHSVCTTPTNTRRHNTQQHKILYHPTTSTSASIAFCAHRCCHCSHVSCQCLRSCSRVSKAALACLSDSVAPCCNACMAAACCCCRSDCAA